MNRNFTIAISNFRDSGLPQFILAVMGIIAIAVMIALVIIGCINSLFWLFALIPLSFILMCGLFVLEDGFSPNFVYRIDILEDFIIVKDERDALRKEVSSLRIATYVKVL